MLNALIGRRREEGAKEKKEGEEENDQMKKKGGQRSKERRKCRTAIFRGWSKCRNDKDITKKKKKI